VSNVYEELDQLTAYDHISFEGFYQPPFHLGIAIRPTSEGEVSTGVD
jgi:hypothetical protein